MMWFFAILIVLALGAIAVVAAGRGTPMSPAYGDSPDALVPAQGPVTADDLRRIRFPLAFRGYRMAEVDALLERLAEEREAAEREAAEREAAAEEESVAPPVSGERGADY
ncbi:MAG: DivIVA domain-containing protein [Nocardioides sp.]